MHYPKEMIVNKPEQRGVMTFLKRVLLLSTPWPVQRPAKWLRWALLSHWTQTVFPMKKSKQILSLNNFIQFFFNFFTKFWLTMMEIICIHIMLTGLHGFIYSEHNAISKEEENLGEWNRYLFLFIYYTSTITFVLLSSYKIWD